MKSSTRELFRSALGGTISTGIFILTAYFLDYSMNPKLSNLIGVILGGIFNFIFQSIAFTGKIKLSSSFNFLLSEIILLGATQLGVVYLFDHKLIKKKSLPIWSQKYYNTIVRLIVVTFGFVFISFPIRKWWVFI